MLGYVAKQRAQRERSFRTAIVDMKQSQKERRQPQPAKPAPPEYVMSERAEAHEAFCAPETPDTR
jgi:hypothetical protein